MIFKSFLLLLFILLPTIAFAQEPGSDISLGQYSLPFILGAILTMFFKMFSVVVDRWKPLIAVVAGTGLGYVALLYSGEVQTAKIIIDYLLYGFVSGLGAIGAYEVARVAYKPRE
jgi:hypothetical protein